MTQEPKKTHPTEVIRDLRSLKGTPGTPEYWRAVRKRQKSRPLERLNSGEVLLPDPRDVSPEEFWDSLVGSGSGLLTLELRELWRRVQAAETRRPGVICVGPSSRMVAVAELARELCVSERRAKEFCEGIGVTALDVCGKWYIMVPDLEYCIWVATRAAGEDTSHQRFLRWAESTGTVYAGLKRLAVLRRLQDTCITDRPGKIVRRGRRKVRVADSVAGLPL